jgi:hypothetical protein
MRCSEEVGYHIYLVHGIPLRVRLIPGPMCFLILTHLG